MRIFELVLGLMVMTVYVPLSATMMPTDAWAYRLGSFVALLVKVSPIWRDVFYGYVPGPGIVAPGALYISVGCVH